MYLKSLEIQGFKSFPDKTLIRFGDDITAIVGPNGSGKSNISDAILWVMGEMSTKTLRGAKMEDVIFGGTQKRAALGFAEATLILDNTDRALSYDADEVMVTRRYYRSGDSEYYINRQSARLRDINEMFMDTGLGREGYSNISQGRIDEILSLKSTDRREIFEEAAGISKYRHRKEETQRRLQTTEDNLLRIGDKITELEFQLEPLKAQAEKAKKYLEYQGELRGLEITVWLRNLEKLTETAKKAEEDYNSASFVLEQEHTNLNDLYRKAEEYAAELRSRDGAMELLRNQLSLMESAHQQFAGQIAVLEGNVENNRQNVARIEEELSQEADRSGGIAEQIRQSQERIREIDEKSGKLTQELVQAQAEYTRLTTESQGLSRRFLELRGQETSLTGELAGRQAELAALENAMAQSQTRAVELDESLSSGSQRRAQAQAALEDSQKKLRTAQDEVSAQNNTIAGYTLRQKSRQERRNTLQEQLRKDTARLDSVSAKARVYRAMERDYESYGKSVRSVMQESSRGALRNIHGPVSRLIRTEDRYATAIEIALGAAMQQIVVDSEQDAKAAIQFLKRTGGGRATFLPLSTIRGRSLTESGMEACRGYVGVADSLVRCDGKYQNIIENLLGRIVIVEDLDSAVAMARKYGNRFKIVTLDGQVMNPGGSMTGGSMSKDAGILSRANELEKLTKEENDLKESLSRQEKELSEAQRSLDQTVYELTTAQEQLRRAEDQVLRLQGEEKQHSVLAQAMADAESAAQKERQSIDRRMAADRENAAAQKARCEALDRQLRQAEQELRKLELDQNQTAGDSGKILDRITAIKTDLAGLDAEKTTASDSAQNLRQLQAAMEGDRSQKQALKSNYEKENERLREQIAGLQQQQEENKSATEAKRRELMDAQAQRAQVEAAKTKSERDAQEKNKDILTMERSCALLEQKKVTAELEQRQIIDRLWDSYGLTPGTAPQEAVEVESVPAATRRIAELRRKISALGTPNLGAIDEYARINERYSYLAEQRDDVLTSKRELEGIIDSITKEMTTIFVSEFKKIDTYFQETFTEMFGGGKGSLVLEDPNDPLNCGIEIRVQPPGKQLKTITLLSGGEKAFVAIALQFAILKVRPTPFCMLDEIDAALDDRNVERFARYLRNLCKKTQFIVITHRRGTMELADVLYGVTMQEQGVSKILHMNLNQVEQELGLQEEK